MSAIIELIFTDNSGDFEALHAAQAWCRERGYSCGSMSNPLPIAIMFGDFQIAKWKNLTIEEREACDGRIESQDFRAGPVKIALTNPRHYATLDEAEGTESP
jgi:hypothetical protein